MVHGEEELGGMVLFFADGALGEGDAFLADERVHHFDVLEEVGGGVELAGEGELDGEKMAERGEGGVAGVGVGGMRLGRVLGGRIHCETDLAGEAIHGGDYSVRRNFARGERNGQGA